MLVPQLLACLSLVALLSLQTAPQPPVFQCRIMTDKPFHTRIVAVFSTKTDLREEVFSDITIVLYLFFTSAHLPALLLVLQNPLAGGLLILSDFFALLGFSAEIRAFRRKRRGTVRAGRRLSHDRGGVVG
jgi:hypothetical protein